jgi:hypothetical protein
MQKSTPVVNLYRTLKENAHISSVILFFSKLVARVIKLRLSLANATKEVTKKTSNV